LDKQIREALELSATAPQERKEQVKPRWTLKRLVEWVKTEFKVECSRQTICKSLKGLGLSWKKARKLLNKADTKKRLEYLDSREDECMDKPM
jgi:transposase